MAGRPKHRDLWRQNIGYGVTKLSIEVVKKLGEAFAIGTTIPEACDYADISPKTYYNWVNKNEELLQYFNRMRQKLPLKAKTNIAYKIHDANASTGDINLSRWLIERSQPETYGETLNLNHTGGIANNIELDDQIAIETFTKTLRDNRIKRSLERAKADGEINENSK